MRSIVEKVEILGCIPSVGNLRIPGQWSGSSGFMVLIILLMKYLMWFPQVFHNFSLCYVPYHMYKSTIKLYVDASNNLYYLYDHSSTWLTWSYNFCSGIENYLLPYCSLSYRLHHQQHHKKITITSSTATESYSYESASEYYSYYTFPTS